MTPTRLLLDLLQSKAGCKAPGTLGSGSGCRSPRSHAATRHFKTKNFEFRKEYLHRINKQHKKDLNSFQDSAVCSHVCRDDLLEIYLGLRESGILQLMEEGIKDLVYWREVFPISLKRGLATSNPSLPYPMPTGRWFLLVVALCMSYCQRCRITGQQGPDPHYVEEAQATLRHIIKLGTAHFLSKWSVILDKSGESDSPPLNKSMVAIKECGMLFEIEEEGESEPTTYWKLQRQLEFLAVQEEYIKDEQRNLKKEYLHAQEEVKRIQSVPLVIGQFLEAVDQNTGIVGSTTATLSSTFSRPKPILPFLCFKLVNTNAARTLTIVTKAHSSLSNLNFSADEKPDVQYSDIGGMDMQKQEIREAVELPLTHFELYRQIGIDPPRGVLMYGPPGCGKTMLAKAVAHHTTAAFIRVVGSEFVQKYLGEGPRMVRDVFRLAKENAPAIIFIDEIDAIATKRFDAQTGADREVQRILLELLNQMDGFDQTTNVKVIMATNRADTLDPALLRPGRLDRKIEFPLPDRRQKRLVFSTITTKMNLSEEVDLEDYVARPDRISGADINAICQENKLFPERAMLDNFSFRLRNQLLADRPSLQLAVEPIESVCRSDRKTALNHPVPVIAKKAKNPAGYREFVKVKPESVGGELGVYTNRGKTYKKVRYGPDDGFLIHRNLNPRQVTELNLCPDKFEELGTKNELTYKSRVEKAQALAAQKNALSDESELRRESFKNAANRREESSTTKEIRIMNKLIGKNAEKALVDKQEEMLDFYRSVGSKQVLAMRERQIQDNEHFKELGLKSREAFMSRAADSGPTEYEEMLSHRKELQAKNRKLVDVLKKQAVEKEILRDLVREVNAESAERYDAFVDAEMARDVKRLEAEEIERQEHFKVNDKITNYRDYVRQVREAEERILVDRENEFLKKKEKFNKAYAEKRENIRKEREKLLNRVGEDLTSEMEKREQEEMEYYYTLEKEKDLRQQDMEVQERLDKKLACDNLMKDWRRITEENRRIKEADRRRELDEKARNDKFLEEENRIKSAEQRKHLVEKDITRMELMYQINERQLKRTADAEAKARETKLLKAEGFVRDGKIRERMMERTDDFSKAGLPDRFLTGIKQHFHL
ncbi:unnamed protein product [Nesidiocoris tenuis]|uniref:AAA+ ATPase domain-containing protein n=1 Tax=Nesidiocoris tenuis TaxID=355587 RepID=A0A6H5HRF2_9HEMI|nr:unnamed protein product [Nesidiocoris tenuis]